jgi:hypothetical protein
VSEISRTITDLQGAGEGLKWIQDNLFNGLRGGPVDVTLGRPKRTNDQNALLWAILTDVSDQVDWYGRRLSKEEWKDVFSAAWKQQEVVPGINGGFVVMGVRTSKMSKAQLSELVEIIYAFGAEKTVKWGDPALKVFADYREAGQ